MEVAVESKLSVKKINHDFRNEERTLIVSTDIGFLAVTKFVYAVYLPLKNPSLKYFIA